MSTSRLPSGGSYIPCDVSQAYARGELLDEIFIRTDYEAPTSKRGGLQVASTAAGAVFARHEDVGERAAEASFQRFTFVHAADTPKLVVVSKG